MKLNIQLFGGSVSIGSVTETTDVSTNKSTFTIPATMTTTGQTFNDSDAYMTLQWRYSGGSTWTNISKKTFGISTNSNKTKSWTLALTHNDDGTLGNVQFRVQWYITNSTNGTSSTKTVTPTTIPRAAIIASANDTTTGNNCSVTINTYSTSFFYKLIFSKPDHSVSYAEHTFTSQLYNPTRTQLISNDWFNDLPNDTTGTMLITLITYNNETEIGREYRIVNITLNSYATPTYPAITISEADSTMVSLNWVNNNVPVYVQNKSKLRVQITSYGVNNSTITQYATGVDGYAYYGNDITTNYIRTSGSITCSCETTDSRGRKSGINTSTIYIEPYSNPTITTPQIQRCDINGNITEEGEYCYVSFGASISSCSNKNKANTYYKIGYRVHNTGDFSYIDVASNQDSYSNTGMLYTDGIYAADRGSGTKLQLPTTNTYDIQFYVVDTFAETTNEQLLDTGFDLMNFNPNGKAMAIGKVSEATGDNKLFEVAMPTTINDLLTLTNGLNSNSYGLNGDYSLTRIFRELTGLSTGAENIDLDTILDTGIYRCYPSTSNKPDINIPNFASYGICFVVKSFDWWYQIYIGNWGIPKIAFRKKIGNNASWDSWEALDSQSNFPTNEQVIGTWIDGKPVYRKVITFQTIDGDLFIDERSLNIKRIINMYGAVGPDNDQKPINFYFYGYSISTRFSSNNLYIFTSTPYAYLEGYVVIEYTKTTD